MSAVDSRWAGSHTPLVERIRDEILGAPGNRIPFARFMELALYAEGVGYYRRRHDRATRTGDFLTAPEVDPIWGHALARQLVEMWERLDRPDHFTLREHGAGSGALGESVLGGLRNDGSPLLEAIRYEPVESGPEHAAAILERLAVAGFGGCVGEPVAGRPFVGGIAANELLDALPVHRLTRTDGTLCEVHVAWRDGWFAGEAAPPSVAALDALTAAGLTVGIGETVEVRPAAERWLADAAADLARGWVVLIDYGDEASELHRRMPAGTLRTYRGHHVGDDPYRAVGEQDLTAHVAVDALEHAARGAGLAVLGRTTQAEFLAGLGIAELLVELRARPDTTAERYLTARSAVRRALDPAYLGRFFVLVLGRSVPGEMLAGLSFRLPVGATR